MGQDGYPYREATNPDVYKRQGIGTLCLVASVGFSHAESIAIPSARPMVDGVSADVETVSSSSKGQQHVNSDVITPNDWTYTALQRLIKHGAITDTHGFTFDGAKMCIRDRCNISLNVLTLPNVYEYFIINLNFIQFI